MWSVLLKYNNILQILCVKNMILNVSISTISFILSQIRKRRRWRGYSFSLLYFMWILLASKSKVSCLIALSECFQKVMKSFNIISACNTASPKFNPVIGCCWLSLACCNCCSIPVLYCCSFNYISSIIYVGTMLIWPTIIVIQ